MVSYVEFTLWLVLLLDLILLTRFLRVRYMNSIHHKSSRWSRNLVDATESLEIYIQISFNDARKGEWSEEASD
jgi:hypothetical protein